MKRLRILGRARQLAENESGGTIAELAILIPFLILMLSAVAELGRFFQTYSTLCKTTRAAARYISKVNYDEDHQTIAKNIAVCGKTNCTGSNPVVTGLTDSNINIEAEYPPGDPGNPVRVTVRVQNYTFQPLFNIGALLNNPTFSLALPVNSSTTMYYMWTEPAGAEEGG
jgi:Flp pilus assembly protein TadG